MKGISPLIATILLIALVVGVGGLVSVFVTDITRTSTDITSNQSISVTKCAGASLNLYLVQNTSGSSRIFYSNPTNQNITNIRLIGDGMTSGDVALIAYLSPGASAANSTGINIGTNTSFTVRGLCQSTQPIEGTCKVGQACWQV